MPLHEVASSEGLTTWLFEPESFSPLAREDATGRYAVVTDHLGAPTEMYDELGQLAWRMQLDAFGVGKADVTLHHCPWRWPGQYEDEETGLLYNRFRYYDAYAGRYISQDPIGLLGGMLSYAYPENPLVTIDPLGLMDVDPRLINFSQRTVAENDYAGKMSSNNWNWDRSGPLRVMDVDGQYVSYDNRRLLAAQVAGLKTVPVEVVKLNEVMPESKKTWEKAFWQRRNDRRNIEAGGVVPRQGIKERPQIIRSGCKK
ncbi:RHS domain-containing protein [Stigmatella sp. ncwal1]|uniref:RHS domain-containing protein n=1 Tax=Stigmatella ashevillensis TaxID=2995309 RepID=A0ABT5DGG7_9BACT|nr:RHS repeat-associated core domain-containing protein [Stigmatella ashevillena]MDC0711451.1 RHS domain-containing protein [Stigmatella ashevillena]